MITVKELIERLSKYRESAIVTVRVNNNDYPVIDSKVHGCFRCKPEDLENANIDFWICSLQIDDGEYIERIIYGK